MTRNQQRHSFSNGNDHSVSLIDLINDDDIITVLGPRDVEENIYPLTMENLAIHTNNFPPSKEARRRQVRLFVEDQRPVVKMYLILEKQRTQEMESYIPDELPIIKFTQQGTAKKKTWLKRLTHWIYKRRHKGHHDICQKRDSGISFFSKHHSTRSSRIATVRHQNNDFAAYKYPKMVRSLLNHPDTISA